MILSLKLQLLCHFKATTYSFIMQLIDNKHFILIKKGNINFSCFIFTKKKYFNLKPENNVL